MCWKVIDEWQREEKHMPSRAAIEKTKRGKKSRHIFSIYFLPGVLENNNNNSHRRSSNYKPKSSNTHIIINNIIIAVMVDEMGNARKYNERSRTKQHSREKKIKL